MEIVSSNDVLFDENNYSLLSYMSHPYSEAPDMRPEVSYIMYDASSHERTGDIVTFVQFEEENIV